MKKTVALISGGEGYEADVSEVSAECLFSAIDRDRFDVREVHISKNGEWYISRSGCPKYIGNYGECKLFAPTFPIMINGSSGFLVDGEVIEVDCAIPALHGDFGEDGQIQGLLSSAHIPYVGQDVYAAAVSSDKIYSKLAAQRLSIPVAKWILSDSDTPSEARWRAEKEIGYPMFIKPARLGSSHGALPIRERSEFESAYMYARGFDKRLIIEELVGFDYELECAYIEDDHPVLIPGGKVLLGGRFYDCKTKYDPRSASMVSVKCDSFSEAELKAAQYARSLCELIGIRHLSRIDFFVLSDGAVIFNEINSFPGMTKTSLYPKMVKEYGDKHGGFLNMLIDRAILCDRRI